MGATLNVGLCIATLVVIVIVFNTDLLPLPAAWFRSWMLSFLYGPSFLLPVPLALPGNVTCQHHTRARLRRRWIHRRRPHSKLARALQRTQLASDSSNCSAARFSSFQFTLDEGLAVNLFKWTEAACEVSARGNVLVALGPWIWRDGAFCGSDLRRTGLSWWRRFWNLPDLYPAGSFSTVPTSAMDCYFTQATQCPLPPTFDETLFFLGRYTERTLPDQTPPTKPYVEASAPFTVRGGEPLPEMCKKRWRVWASGVELLFHSLPAHMVAAAECALQLAFGGAGAPPDMITVHIRWGDKSKEAALVSIDEYVGAVKAMVVKHKIRAYPTIFITTEDPDAIKSFKRASPRHWVLRYDASAVGGAGQARIDTEGLWHYVESMLMSTTATGARDTGGALGFHSIMSLLIALEAKYFVLTNSSNWSKLINLLRRVHVDVDCDSCTDVVVLGEPGSVGVSSMPRHLLH